MSNQKAMEVVSLDFNGMNTNEGVVINSNASKGKSNSAKLVGPVSDMNCFLFGVDCPSLNQSFIEKNDSKVYLPRGRYKITYDDLVDANCCLDRESAIQFLKERNLLNRFYRIEIATTQGSIGDINWLNRRRTDEWKGCLRNLVKQFETGKKMTWQDQIVHSARKNINFPSPWYQYYSDGYYYGVGQGKLITVNYDFSPKPASEPTFSC